MLKRCVLVCAGLLALAVGPVPAARSALAGDGLDWQGPYLGLQIGAGPISDRLTESTGLVPPLTGHADFDKVGFGFGGHAGYNWQFGHLVIGPEGDFEGTLASKTNNCLIQDAGAGNIAPGTCFAPIGSYTFTTKMRWRASLRGRVGYAFDKALLYATGGAAFADFRTSYVDVLGGGGESFDETRTGYTVGAGLEYAFTPNWHGRLEYRYADYCTLTNFSTTAGPFWDGYNNHHAISENTVRLGVTYLFGAPPPAPPMAPAAAAPPPEARKVFLVFFDWDRDTITPEGMAIVRQAADAYKAGAPVRIMVTGYTDRSGSAGYNQRLSERRANNVAKALAGLGVPKTQMAVSGRGENDNRVPTADGVREPQNRRVEIVF